jgi:hypothetical protein
MRTKITPPRLRHHQFLRFVALHLLRDQYRSGRVAETSRTKRTHINMKPGNYICITRETRAHIKSVLRDCGSWDYTGISGPVMRTFDRICDQKLLRIDSQAAFPVVLSTISVDFGDDRQSCHSENQHYPGLSGYLPNSSPASDVRSYSGVELYTGHSTLDRRAILRKTVR